MKKSLQLLLAVFFTLNFVSCNDDDDDSSTVSTTEDFVDRATQASADDLIIQDFLKNYTYNDLELEANASYTDQDIEFYKLSEIESVTTKTSGISLLDSDNLSTHTHTYEYDDDGDEGEITQTYYTLAVRGGENEADEIGKERKNIYEADRVKLTYQTKVILTDDSLNAWLLLEDEVDEELDVDADDIEINLDEEEISTWFSSVDFIDGFNQALTKFKTGSPTDETNPCSIFGVGESGSLTTNNDFGIGIVIMPSGLAYFNSKQYFNNYEANDDDEDTDSDDYEDEDYIGYRNLILTFSTYNAFDQDFDGDGIPSLDEDVDGDEDFDDDDTDEDDIPNYYDADDDGDGVATFLEILIDDFDDDVDSDCDGIPDNDNEVKFIYTNLNSQSDTDKLKFAFPGDESIGESEIPYHLDSSVEFDEDDYDADNFPD